MNVLRSRRVAAWGVVAASAVVLGVSACPQNPPPPTDSFDRNAMLRNVADTIIVPAHARAQTAAAALYAAVASWRDATGDGAAERGAAQAAWIDAMRAWQRVELLQVGPAGAAGVALGGENLRDAIYSWPTVNPCAVDQQIVANAFTESGWTQGRLVNVVGLDALEYLLFHEGSDNACPSPSTINANGSWAAIGLPEIEVRRAAYAAVLAADVKTKVDALAARWTGGFADQFANAGTDTSVYPTAQAAIDDLFAAIFYVDLRTKDEKLAVPAGLNVACGAESCPQRLELRFSRQSAAALRENLIALRDVLRGQGSDGTDGSGFDDFLAEVNAPELSTDLLAATDNAIAAVEGLGVLEDTIVDDVVAVRAAHDAVKAVTDLVKTQFVSALGVRIPEEGSGDND